MHSQRFRATLTLALVLWTCSGPAAGWPLSESTTAAPTRKFLKSSVVTSVSVVGKQNGGKPEGVHPETNRSPAIGVNLYRLPPSPANLLKPDRFQFYTYNERGDMITKQMTMQEIQALIASGGPDHSNMGIQEPQKAEDILTGGKKVMDVVEKVQNVLKSAMGKPSTLAGSVSTVPEKASAEWSNILPAILAGDKYGDKEVDGHRDEGASSEPPFASTPSIPDSTKPNKTGIVPIAVFESAQEKQGAAHGINSGPQKTPAASTSEPSIASYTEKIMIPVPVITAEQKPQTTQRVTQSPVFHKITEMLLLETAAGNHHQDVVSDVPPAFSQHANDGDDAAEAASATLQSVSEIIEDSETKTEPPMVILMQNGNTNRPSLGDDVQFKPPAMFEPKLPTFVANEPISSFSSEFVTSTDEPSKVSRTESTTARDAATSPSDSESTTQLTKPLSAELEDSLSSMINQVSDTSVPSLLAVSSGFELPYRETIIDEKSKNGSERISTISTFPMELPGIIYDDPINIGHTAKERVKGSTEMPMETVTEAQERNPSSTLSTLASASVPTSTVASVETTSVQDNSVKSEATQVPLNSQFVTNATEASIKDAANDSLSSSTTVSDQTRSPVTVTVPSTEEITTLNPFDSSKADVPSSNPLSKLDGELLSNINWVAIANSIIQTASTEANRPITQSVILPVDNPPTKTLASSLIAGFQPVESRKPQEALPTTVTASETQSPTESSGLKLETQSATSVAPMATETLKMDDSLEGSTKAENETLSMTSVGSEKTNSQATDSPKEPATVASTERTVSDATTSIEKTQLESESSSTIVPDVNSKDVTTDASDSSSTEATKSNETSQEQGEDQLNAGTTETTVSESTVRLERLPEEAFKKDDKTSMTNSSDFVSPSSTERVEETTLDATTTRDPLRNGSPSTVATPTSVDKGTTDSSSKEQPTPQRNETIVGSKEIRNATAVTDSKLSTDESSTVRTATQTNYVTDSASVETTVNTSPPIIKCDEEKEIANDTSDDDSQRKNANATKPQVESQGNANKKPDDSPVTQNPVQLKSQANETLESGNITSSELNSSSDVDLDEKWQRIPLRQTTPSIKSESTSKPPETVSIASTPSTSSVLTEGSGYQETSTPPANQTQTVSLTVSKNEVSGLDISTRNASIDVVNFSRFCNELAFGFWIAANKGLSTSRSLTLSPFGMVSLLAMVFLGARGPTSDQMNEVLGLDNVATFNPHLIFQNVTDAVSLARNQGIANAAFVRELFADKTKIRKLLPFYKEQAQQFYEGLVAEVNFATISDLARRRTNLLIRKQTGGRIKDFVKSNAVPLRSPLAAISANVFQTDCNASLASTSGRDGELYFAVSSAHRLRKLIPVPAAVWRANVLAGYEPSLDATVIALGGVSKLVSTIFILPGQQGHMAPGDTLDRLEQRLVKGASRGDGSWNKLLRVLIPRPGLELQIPKFSHRSVVNATAALKRMGLDQLFSSNADLKGIGNRLFLSDVLQMNLFSTCGGENVVNGRHHVETYPANPTSRNSRFEESTSSDNEEVDLPSKNYRAISVREANRNYERSEDKPRLKLDQPFLYFVRHNPTGLILHMGRFNPRSM